MVQKEGSGHVSILSCPPFANKYVVSDPWSTEWLKDRHRGLVLFLRLKESLLRREREK